jgi:hypothetical protein
MSVESWSLVLMGMAMDLAQYSIKSRILLWDSFPKQELKN